MAGEIQDRVQGSKSLAKVMEFDRKLAKIASQKAKRGRGHFFQDQRS
jgi:hypothetical protein